MKIGIIGATGKAGSRILKEALDRGHEVTAIVRSAAKITEENVKILEKDVFTLTSNDLQAFDVVANAFAAPAGQEHLHVDAGNVLIEAMKGTPNTKLLVVGGAGSLFVDAEKTTRVFDTPGFPNEYLATAQNQGKNLEILQQTNDITWTFISPSALFALGKRTGSYTAGKDNLLVNSKGDSYVSYEDFAVAALDEIENPKHVNERFTVVSEAE
ncbi:NAD(P)-dependent oxidoreductase [Bacillus mycoides]|uniref:NAD(P)-dependent oxidoreductase n=1 Tax=Bacillus mycoides TaxID=1405 RepID=UPI001C02003C|nr:NAD(P)-dependent oxidoreductase [Bacillus mycoides]QWG61143.1 NAD(P)-dependent oxidoreductase [Bacillus mycoides]QWG92237.1 NAD(P)-dependent oxidoreductase [Bacillus mycoides]QWJ06094.1 NAD(P)-dependent oxidoreductase [Bacillus mycoides]